MWKTACYLINSLGFGLTGPAITELVDETSIGFSKDEYKLSVFIDLTKAFNIVNDPIVFSKLNIYGIK